MSLYTARIVILINAESEAAACDVISETLREVITANDSDLIGWSYSLDNTGAFTKPYPVDTEYLNIAKIYDITTTK